METSSKCNVSIPVLVVLYDFRYTWKDNREIAVKKGEKLFLLEKTNRDWWQVVRPTERKSFFVPAQYVEFLAKRKQEREEGETFAGYHRTDQDSVLYENLDNLKQRNNSPLPLNVKSKSSSRSDMIEFKSDGGKSSHSDSGRQKPVPKTRTKVGRTKGGEEDYGKERVGEVSETDSKRSFMSRLGSTDNNDNVNPPDKIKQDPMMMSNETSSGAFEGNRSYRGVKGVTGGPIAVENLVYHKVPVVSEQETKARGGEGATRQKMKPVNYPNKLNVDAGKNRMKNSYNLKTRPFMAVAADSSPSPPSPVHSTESDRSVGKQCSSSSSTVKNEKLGFGKNFSKSLEKLAEEIRFEPRKNSTGSTIRSTSSADSSGRGGKSSGVGKNRRDVPEKKGDGKMGKCTDASVVLDENKPVQQTSFPTQSKSVFSRFRRSLNHSNSFKANNLRKLGKGGSSKKACELSLSWEGGLDKIQEKKENEEKEAAVIPLGLQRSRTFMFPERSPLSVRPANKLFSGKHRLDTAYHSQRMKPDEKVTLSTFKPIFNVDVTLNSAEGKLRDDAKSFIGRDKEPVANSKRSASSEPEKKKSVLLSSSRDKKSDLKGISQETTAAAESSGFLASKNPSKKNHDHDSVTKGHKKGAVAPEILSEYQVPDAGSESLTTLYSEPYCSNSESEDNLEEKSLALFANKSLMSQSSVDSNLAISEGTEASESDENSLEFALERPRQVNRETGNKKRTSLVRSSRVESSKVRKVPARLPLTPPPELKPIRNLGDGWGQYISKGGRSFYYNVKTQEKNWKPPRKVAQSNPNQDAGLIGSFESVYSDAVRSSTSSPLNESYPANSLNRSNGSLSSKTNAANNLESVKIMAASCWREDNHDELNNRSSYNSSPVAGLSQSSGYSLNKSSRDSLNRFSSIDNIPSEEEGFELHDHVLYKNDNSEIGANRRTTRSGVKGENGAGKEGPTDASMAFRIKPGWEEFYDENLDQIFYVYKDRKERWILSFDSEERAYFFEETSKKSLWTLPDYSGDNAKPDFPFSIQRSATESAISSEVGAPKLRQSTDGDKGNRISGSARSSKTQSMLIEPPKFDISAGSNEGKTYSMPRDLSKIYGEIIHVGVLNKTKISENGKKLRKNWTPSFVVLTDSYLFFFKDVKSFQNMKNIVSPSNNHMCLSLQGAVIEKGDKISSRKNVYKISCSDNTDVLIQTEKSSEGDDWFREINSVIQNLPLEVNTAVSSSLSDSSSPSKVGRRKSLKVRNKELGSVEDLSSTSEDRQNKIKAKLKKFFIRRPTVDSLKKKGIWKDEPVFGCSLEQVTKNRNPRVPIFVEKCIECIESKEENMKTDGLYRASGNLSQVQKIRLEVDQNNLNIMRDEEDVHVLTGSLKLFFRELKEPLIPSRQLEPALLATDKQIRKERIRDFQKIVKSLPPPNYDTLKFLLQHLLRVKEFHKYNRMNINNLAIVFGPTLMWPEQESANMALELMQQNVVIECLLKEFHEIFV